MGATVHKPKMANTPNSRPRLCFVNESLKM